MARSLEESRVEFHEKLCTFLGSRNVYFQPSENTKLQYPAILYNLIRYNQRFADNISYRKMPSYSVTVVVCSADLDLIPRMLDSFTYCSLERPPYVADGLVHYPFEIYYL